MKDILELKNIWVKYDKAEILKGISLSVSAGTITTLIGANGAGKTTTLRAISGLIGLIEGEIWFDGKRIDQMRAENRVKIGIAHAPEGRRVFPYMSVLENLLTGAYLRRDSKVKEDLKMVLSQFPKMQERLGQKAGSLSGGEQQMLAMGRALMSSPRIMLLDEPTMGLSPLMVMEVLHIIKGVNSERGVAILLIEQNAKMALALAERGYVLETGAITMADKAKVLLGSDHVRKAYLGG